METLTAEYTGGIEIVGIEGRSHFGAGTAHRKIKHFVDLDLIAGPDTAAAEHAFVKIALDHGVGTFQGVARRLDRKPGFFYFKKVNQVLQFTLTILFAGQTVMVSGRPEEFDNQFLGIPESCLVSVRTTMPGLIGMQQDETSDLAFSTSTTQTRHAPTLVVWA